MKWRSSVRIVLGLMVMVAVTVGCAEDGRAADSGTNGSVEDGTPSDVATADPARPRPDVLDTAVFAGGCFWCMEEAFEKVPGVYEVVSGYAGGPEPNPDYYSVAYGRTGHREAVQVQFDPTVVSYADLLEEFWHNVDPLDGGGQFCDRGPSYETGIFYKNDEQRRAALTSRDAVNTSNRFTREVVTEITPLDVIAGDENDGFWPAEEYHQNYYRTSPIQYRLYKEACGRERRLTQLWDGPTYQGY